MLVRRRGLAAVRPGQVAVLRTGATRHPAGGHWIVKRVAAAPGDPVPGGGFPVTETVVPRDMVLLLGDNPVRSADSRQRGCYSGDLLVGIVVRPMTPRL